MRHTDIEAGLRLCRASRWNQTARDWARFLEADPSGTMVAVRDGRVIGTAATIRYGEAAGAAARFGWIGMVLVDPEARGHGLGTALLSGAVDLLGDVPARLDATPAGYPIYLKRGFVEECRLRRMQGRPSAAAVAAVAGRSSSESEGKAPTSTATSTAMSPDANLELRPMSAADLPAVIAWDARIFGAPRGEMLEWMFAGAPEYASVATRDGRIAGYTFGRHGFTFEHLGPIVAIDASLAAALTGDCLSRYLARQHEPAPEHDSRASSTERENDAVREHRAVRAHDADREHDGEREFIIDASCHAPEWTDWLERIGFREQRPFIRMCRGGQPSYGEPRHQFAIVGPEFG